VRARGSGQHRIHIGGKPCLVGWVKHARYRGWTNCRHCKLSNDRRTVIWPRPYPYYGAPYPHLDHFRKYGGKRGGEKGTHTFLEAERWWKKGVRPEWH
jgi:hypothetical protein